MSIKDKIKPFYHSLMFWKNTYPYRNYQKKHKCVFIHIPKTAGTSILHQLNKGKWTPRIHATWKEYQKRSPHFFKSYFKFSFVRNPWDRAVSTYFYIKQSDKAITTSGEQLKEVIDTDKLHTFNDYVLNYLNKDIIWSHNLLIPQWFYILDDMNRLQVDYLGKFENLDNDFDYIKLKIGIKNSMTLEKVNTSDRKNYKEYYTAASRDKIAELYSRDIDLFDYKF